MSPEELEAIPTLPQDAQLAQALAHHRQHTPQRLAVAEGEQRLSWEQLTGRCYRLANRLAALEIRDGARVAMLSRNSLELHQAFVGTLLAGGCAVPLPSMASERALQLMLQDCGAQLVLVSSEYREMADALRQALGDEARRLWVGLDFEYGDGGSLQGLIQTGHDEPPPAGPADSAPFNIIYSSGTTGTPKGILHHHGMRRTQAGSFGASMNPAAVNIVSTPLYSNTTLVLWYPTLFNGGANILMRKFNEAQWCEQVALHKASHAMLVPVQYDRLLRSEALAQHDLSSLTQKFVTSSPMRAELKRAVVDRMPGHLVEFYGLTEGGIGTVLFADLFPDKLASVGQCMAGELRIIDEQGKQLPAGQTGEIVGRNATMMQGYINRKADTDAMIWKDSEGNTFFRSGDIGRLDEDGFLYLSDRKKDVIISGGLNIYATDLEAVLHEHPLVHEAAAIGVPSEQWGETPLGLAVLEPGADIAATELLRWANERLGKSQRLSAVEFRDQLPKSEIGKVLKRELRQPYWETDR